MDQVELGQILGRLEEGQRTLVTQLSEHTKQDEANFKALNAKLDKLDVEPLVRRVAVKWAVGAGSAIIFLAQVAQALGLL